MTIAAHLLEADICSEQGRRLQNEDSYGTFGQRGAVPVALPSPEILERRGYLFVVADGIGGHDSGDVASAMAVREILRGYYSSSDPNLINDLKRVIIAANSSIHLEAQRRRRPGVRAMGTTVVCAVIRGDTLIIAHIGDSRAYHVGRHGVFVTRDHADSGKAGRLTRAVGIEPSTSAEVNVRRWEPTDRLLLCTDGLHGTLDDSAIVAVLRGARPAMSELVRLAYEAGSGDNITAMLVRHRPEAAGRGPEDRVSWSALSALVVAIILLVGFSITLTAGQRAVGGPERSTPPTSTSVSVQALVTATAALPDLAPSATSTPQPLDTPVPSPTPTPTVTPIPLIFLPNLIDLPALDARERLEDLGYPPGRIRFLDGAGASVSPDDPRLALSWVTAQLPASGSQRGFALVTLTISQAAPLPTLAADTPPATETVATTATPPPLGELLATATPGSADVVTSTETAVPEGDIATATPEPVEATAGPPQESATPGPAPGLVP